MRLRHLAPSVRSLFLRESQLLVLGYDTGVIAGALPYMYMPRSAGGLAINEFEEGLVGAFLALGAALGAIVGGRLSDRYGRRHNILLLAGIFILGTLGCTFAPNVAILYIFRFILGLAVGGASATVPVYLAESAPTRVRGSLVALDQFMIVFGQLLAYSMNAILSSAHGGPQVFVSEDPSGTLTGGQWYPWDQVQHVTTAVITSGDGLAWRWMLVLATIPAVCLWLGMRLMPESGRWYASKERYYEAIGALKRIRDPKLDNLGEEIAQIAELQQREDAQGHWSLRRTVSVKWTRRLLLIGIGLACFDQLTGINTAMYYLPKILAAAGFSAADSITLNVITGAVACLGAGFGLYLVSRLARRHVGIYQETGVTLSLFALAIVFGFGISPYVQTDGTISQSIPTYLPWLVVILVSLFVFAKQSGTVNWVLVSEIFPSKIRGRRLRLADERGRHLGIPGHDYALGSNVDLRRVWPYQHYFLVLLRVHRSRNARRIAGNLREKLQREVRTVRSARSCVPSAHCAASHRSRIWRGWT